MADANMLGRTFDTVAHDPNWSGSGEIAWMNALAMTLMNDPAALQSLGLSSSDFGYTPNSYTNDYYNPEQYNLSGAAKNALSGLTVNRMGYGGMKDGRSMVVKDASGNIVSIGNPYSYDPSGDLQDAALKAAITTGGAYLGGQALGLEGAATGSTASALSAPTAIGGGEIIPASMLAPPASSLASIEAAALSPLSVGTVGAAGAAGGALGAGMGGGGAGATAGKSMGLLEYLSSPQGMLSAGGNLLSGFLGSNAAGKAADAQLAAARESNALQKYIFDTLQAQNKPLLDLRNQTLPQIQNLMADPSSITSDPGYQFGLDQGMKSLDQSAASKGMLYSGAQMKGAQQFGQDYAGSKLTDSLNRLMGVAGLGQVGANSNQQAATNYGNTVGNTLQDMGNSRASGYVGGANAWGNALGNAFNDWQFNNLWGGR